MLFLLIKQEEMPFSEFVNFNDRAHSVILNVLQKNGVLDAKIDFTLLSTEIVINIIFASKRINLPTTTIKGPNIKAPQHAIEGFLKKHSLKRDECSTDEKHNIVFVKPSQSIAVEEIIPKLILQTIQELSEIFTQILEIKPFPWVRPVKSLSAHYLGKNITTDFSIGDHSVHTMDEYLSLCKKNDIITNFSQRVECIQVEIAKIEKDFNIKSISKSSILELASLYDSPKFCLATIPNQYLSLPREILKLTVAKNQRYILFEDNNGNISETFLIVGKLHNNITLQGHLKTLKARLEDASYYIEKDIKTFDTKRISPSLSKIIFHQRYGTITKRVQEMYIVAHSIFNGDDNLQDAIKLCKNDLTSNIVQSFPELQGYCGGFYLKNLGIKQEIVDAVSEHYKPLNPGDNLPIGQTAYRLSLVDKIHKVNCLSEIGEVPTSSRDPFAVRRDILSIIRICVHYKLDINRDVIHKDLQHFVTERAKLYLEQYTDFDKTTIEAKLKRFEIEQTFVSLV